VSIKTQSRDTVAGLLLKRLGDEVWVGIHQSAKAHRKGYFRRTTVGGGIEPEESPLQAMRRELVEEYGRLFASECLIEELPIPTDVNVGSDGTTKSYKWMLIIHQGLSEPWLQLEECMDFEWHPFSAIQDCAIQDNDIKDNVIQVGHPLYGFSDGKARMLLRSLLIAAWIRPELFK